MTIPVQCDCGEKYQVKDELAGKRIRCRTCKMTIAVPGDEPDEEEDDWGEPALPAPKAPPKVKAKPKQAEKPVRAKSSGGMSSSEAEEHADQQRTAARGFGTSMMIAGVLAIVLPFFGLQLRALAKMGDQASAIVGVILFVIGAISFAASGMVSVAPSRASRSSDDDDEDDAPADYKVSNPGEKAAKAVLWTIIIAMLSIPALIFGVIFLAVFAFAWKIAVPVLILVIALIVYFVRRRRASRPTRKKARKATIDDE